MGLFIITPINVVATLLAILLLALAWGYRWYQKQEAAEITYEYFDIEVSAQESDMGGICKGYRTESRGHNLRRINGLHVWQVARRYWHEDWLGEYVPYAQWEFLNTDKVAYVEKALEENREIILYFDWLEEKSLNGSIASIT